MPPSEFHPHHLRRPPLHRHRHRSTAQLSLFKILHTISVFSAGDVAHKQQLSTDESKCESRVLNVDLNISLHLPTVIEPVEPPVKTEDGGDAENCSSAKNNNDRIGDSYDLKQLVEDQRRIEGSEICYVGDRSSEIDNNGVSDEENRRDDGYLGLLIEAAELILIDHESKPPRRSYLDSSAPVTTEIGGGRKRKPERWTAEWWPEIDGTSPALKSKRGRNVVLPEKYRDSFVEPLVRWTPSCRRSKSPVEVAPAKQRVKR